MQLGKGVSILQCIEYVLFGLNFESLHQSWGTFNGVDSARTNYEMSKGHSLNLNQDSVLKIQIDIIMTCRLKSSIFLEAKLNIPKTA